MPRLNLPEQLEHRNKELIEGPMERPPLRSEASQTQTYSHRVSQRLDTLQPGGSLQYKFDLAVGKDMQAWVQKPAGKTTIDKLAGQP